MEKRDIKIGAKVKWYRTYGGKLLDVIDAQVEAMGRGPRVLVSFQNGGDNLKLARWVVPENLEPMPIQLFPEDH